MTQRTSQLASLAVASLVSLAAACTPDGPDGDPPECSGIAPCASEPHPGFAKFTVGRADSVRWDGFDGCAQLELRTGREGEARLTKVEGTSQPLPTCDDEPGSYAFVYLQHSKELASTSWTTAYRPLDARAAEVLLESCTWDSRPEPASLVGHWWRANNTYAENRIRLFIDPLAYATQLLPFDDDGFERVGEAVVEGQRTIHFRNEAAEVWMLADVDGNRPARVSSSDSDLRFAEWDAPFEAALPAQLRELSEVCERQ